MTEGCHPLCILPSPRRKPSLNSANDWSNSRPLRATCTWTALQAQERPDCSGSSPRRRPCRARRCRGLYRRTGSRSRCTRHRCSTRQRSLFDLYLIAQEQDLSHVVILTNTQWAGTTRHTDEPWNVAIGGIVAQFGIKSGESVSSSSSKSTPRCTNSGRGRGPSCSRRITAPAGGLPTRSRRVSVQP